MSSGKSGSSVLLMTLVSIRTGQDNPFSPENPLEIRQESTSEITIAPDSIGNSPIQSSSQV